MTKETVLTVSLIAPFQSIPFNKQRILFSERLPPMMPFLVCYITRYSFDIGVRDGECSITSPPEKFSFDNSVLVYPMRRASFQELYYVFNADVSRKINQRMGVVRIDVVDLHVDPFLQRIRVQKARCLSRCSFVEHWLTRERFPNQMCPKTRVRMSRHCEGFLSSEVDITSGHAVKPLKRFPAVNYLAITWLKPGVNERGTKSRSRNSVTIEVKQSETQVERTRDQIVLRLH